MTTVDHGWRLLRLAELLRAIEGHEDRLLRILNDVEPSMRPTTVLSLKRAHVERLQREVAEIAQLAEQADALVEAIPAEPVQIAYEDLRVGAERVLRQSMTVDPAAVLLAAQVLDRPTGLHALAEGLRATDACSSWEGTTVGGLLTAFRGVSLQLARRIATAAALAPGTEIAECRPEQIAQLADQLDRHAEG